MKFFCRMDFGNDLGSSIYVYLNFNWKKDKNIDGLIG